MINKFERGSLNKTEEEGEEVLEGGASDEKAVAEVYSAESIEKIEKLSRDENVMKVVERLRSGAEMSEEENELLGGMIGRLNGANVYNKLNAGDVVVVFIVPSGGVLSIKNMNDNIFGPQKTDEIIAERRILMSQFLNEANVDVLEQDFKTGVCKIGEGGDGSKLQEIMESVCKRVDKEMEEFICCAVDEEIGVETDEEKKSVLAEFKSTIKRSGYRVTYGMAEVGEGGKKSEGDMSHIELSLAQGTQSALLARREKEKYGAGFENESVMREFGEINDLRKKIMDELGEGQMHDKSGVGFKVFREEGGLFVMNGDVMRAVRKGKFKLREQDEAKFGPILRDLEQYVRRINVLDIMKPFTHEEISGEVNIRDREEGFKARMEEQGALSARIRSGEKLNEEEVERVADLLENASKNEFCTSSEKFHSEVLDIKDCTYIALDRLDLGVDLLREFEKLQQQVVKGDVSLEEASVRAGDSVTVAMRKMRKDAFDKFNEVLPGEDFLTLVGGDELTLAINNDKVSADQVDELIFKLHEQTNSRVITTVFSESVRKSEGDDKKTKLEHLDAIKRTEKGADISKKIEEGKRVIKLKLEQTQLMKGVGERERDEFVASVFDALEISSFVIMEGGAEGEFIVKGKAVEGGVKKKSESGVRRVLERVGEYVSVACDADADRKAVLEAIGQMRE